MIQSPNDTIVACATPAGYSSIGIVRISGEKAVEFTTRLFQPHDRNEPFRTYHAYYGSIIDASNAETIDKVIAIFYLAPHSYTGDDVVEISCHGNPLIINRILQQYITQGCRTAERGEFTKRALLSGKIDLLQAEAVLDTVYSPCEEARKLAIAQYEGKLSEIVYDIRSELVDLLVLVEAQIDFAEEDDVARCFDKDNQYNGPLQTITKKIRQLVNIVEEVLSHARTGMKLKQGFRVLIMGRANVGKSTLFNRMVGYDRSIIHERPGTTRDYVDDSVEIGGIYLRLYDTAGLLNQPSGLDRIAQDRTIELIKAADLILLLFDGSEPMNEQDVYLYNLTKTHNTLFVVNKVDLNVRLSEEHILSDSIKISAKTGENYDMLVTQIKDNLVPVLPTAQPLITRERHLQAFRHLQEYLCNAQGAQSTETMAFELNAALDVVGELTGRVLSKDILNRIFDEFCIGK